MRGILWLAALGGAAGPLGCAHRAAHAAHDAPDAEMTQGAAPAPVRPRNQRIAREMIATAFSQAAEGRRAEAAGSFAAILASDFLTDRGRANLYWVLAGLYRGLAAPEAEAAALGGFLVTSSLLPTDEELTTRQLVARSIRAALRVQSQPEFGRSPEAPIGVEDAREPSSIVASLACGDAGSGHYIDVAIDAVGPMGGERLLRHRVACDESGDVLDLWFDVTYARNEDSPTETEGNSP